MLTRYRWYRIHLPQGAPDITTLVVRHPLVPDAPYGFSVVEQGFGGPWLRFLWRTKVLITRLDDEGAPVNEEIASVSFTNFAVIALEGITFLRIENPGRNIRDLLNALESMVGLGFTAKLMTFDRIKPTTVFEKMHVSKLVGLKVVGAAIEEDLVARMEFASKGGMFVEKMKFLEGLQYKVDLAVFELIYESVRGQVAFSAGGTVKVSGQLAPKLLNLIEQDLPNFG